jgi:hypothetical protein
MITKQALIEEIEALTDEQSLELVYQLIQAIKKQQNNQVGSHVMAAFNNSLTEFDDLYREK